MEFKILHLKQNAASTFLLDGCKKISNIVLENLRNAFDAKKRLFLRATKKVEWVKVWEHQTDNVTQQLLCVVVSACCAIQK